jgi:galactose mutarotase-like enzyme
LEVQPERGGRIRSLRLDGEELLDQGIGVDDPSAAGFVAGGAWGWDELVPTVDRATWRGIDLPDHGEAWRLSWTVVESGESWCAMACEGRLLPWRLERRLELGASVRATYRLSNRGDVELPGYWCSHALFRYEDGMEVDAGAKLVRFARGKSGKFFVPPGSIDRARLTWPEGMAVELGWDASKTPHVGVWVCNGDLGGYRQVAIEPATGGGDRPDSDEPPPVLAPGESIDWWLEIRRATEAEVP